MRPLRMIAIAVLGVLGLCGLAGGLALVTDPSGARLRLTVDQLPAWPLLDDYTVPGIALIVLFGLLPLAAAGLLARRHRARVGGDGGHGAARWCSGRRDRWSSSGWPSRWCRRRS